ncbi:phosphorylase [[Phormidium ambiguum] IAM M-71]|uniref:Phosphorylase n=1 Tax=[Phormidium ambiguum] IAM M-71 TaxID=454136 RepID=A0A1U7I3K7_9CYAN|nr:phosphorylase [Phormidium ambiguum]OKH30714.1 phosphorylase [Phormidium ambiguum IAM M-71]
MTNKQLIILVPKGAEYQSVCRGIGNTDPRLLEEVGDLNSQTSAPLILPIPVGVKALTQYLENDFSLSPSRVLIMGLCGSLSPKIKVGDVVLYENCRYEGEVLECDRSFTSQIYNHLKTKVALVKSLTSDSVVYSASEKRSLAETYAAEVVDMEGFAALTVLSKRGISVAMLRVVSDDSEHNIPNLNSAIDEKGNLQPLPLAWEMITQPIAALNLIKGSLQGLKLLQQVASQITLT